MDSLTFTCTHTGRAIETGINTDQTTLSFVQAVTIPVLCPHCGMTHRFPVRSGQLDPRLYRCRAVRFTRNLAIRRQSI